MAIISITGMYSVPKRRPKRYKARDAPYAVGGNAGAYIALLPRPYPKNEPQKKISALAELCKIEKGMKKADLMNAMRSCVTPANYRKV